MLKLSNISASRIKTFNTCRFQYYLQYVLKAEMRSNWGAAHGSLIHDVLENYTNGNDTDWMSRLYRGYGGTLKALDRHGQDTVMESPLVWAKPKEFHDKKPMCDTCPHAIDGLCNISLEPLDQLTGCPKALFRESIEMIENVMYRYEHIWPKLLDGGTEYAFKIPLAERSDVPIIGFMDLVLAEDDETIHVVDYKAGKKTQDFHECCEDIQARMYSLACRKEFIEDVNNRGFNYKNVVLTFDYFRNKPTTLSFTAEEDAETEREVIDKIHEIESTTWIDRIVRSDNDFEDKCRFGQVAFTCKYLCDIDVCKANWNGRFKVGEDNGQNH